MTSAPQISRTRPTSVTVAVAFGWLTVAIDIATGAAMLALAGNADVTGALGVESSTAQIYGIVSIVFAALVAVVVYMLAQGRPVARMVVTVVMAVRLLGAVWALFAFGTHGLAETLVQGATAAAVIALLWNQSASAFFAGDRDPA